MDGRIEVTAHSGPNVQIRAIKEVSRASSDAEAKRVADKVKVRIEQVGNHIEIEAEHPERHSSFGEPYAVVHFEIRTPRLSNLDAKSVDGRLEVTSLDGDLRLSTVDGDLLAALQAKSTDGDIVIRVQPDSAMTEDWSIRTTDGSIRLELTLRRRSPPSHSDEGRLG